MQAFDLYVSNQYQNQYNTKYAKQAEIKCFDDLLKAAAYDHVSAKLKNSHRGDEDFISDNCVIMDCDNTHSNDSDEWFSPDDVTEVFTDVQCFVVYSRNHMKPKEKDGVIQEPRPKFHLYFPLRNTETDKDKAKILRKRIICMFPYFDVKCLDLPHFMFGVKDSTGEEYDGTVQIDDFIAKLAAEQPDAFLHNLEDGYKKIDDEETKKKLLPLFDFLGKPKKESAGSEGQSNQKTDSKDSFEESIDFVTKKIEEWGINYKKRGSSIFVGDCFWKENHTSGDDKAKIIVHPSGSIGFKCHHEHCADKHWRDVRLFFEPDAYDSIKNFHVFNKDGTARDTIDAEIVDFILRKNNIFTMAGIPYIEENGTFDRDETGNKVKQLIKPCIYKRLQTAQRINRIYNLLLMDTSIAKELDEINLYPDFWVPFNNGMWDAKEETLRPHSPKYYCINKIPHDYVPGYEIPEDSIQKKMFETKIPDADDREMLLEYLGISMTKDTHLQKFLFYEGEGDTGKSTLIRNHDNAIGKKNRSSLSLQQLNERFYPTSLFGKLTNTCADIKSEAMKSVENIKKATGEDELMGEIKGGAIFFFTSYAKLIFSANSVPLSRDDYTNAYYRRLLILSVEYGEYIPELEQKLPTDIQSYFHLCMDALHRLYERNGKILISENCLNRVHDLYKTADNVFAFIEERCIRTDNSKGINRTELYKEYEEFCHDCGRESLPKHSFYTNLSEKGFGSRVRNGTRYIVGLDIADKDFEDCADTDSPF